MTPSTTRVVVELPDRRASPGPRSPRPSSSTKPALDPDLRAAAEDLLEIDHRGRVAADDDDAPARRPAVDVAGTPRRPRRRRRGSRRRSGAPSSSRARAVGHRQPAVGGRQRVARLAAPATTWRVSRARPRSRRAARRRGRSSCPRTTGRSTDGRLTSTFAAAPRAAASPSSAATFRSLEALTLLRPASASAASTSSRHASTHQHRDLCRACGRRPAGPRRAASRSSSVSRGQLQGRGEPGVGGGVVVGQRRGTGRRGAAGLGRPIARSSACSRVLRAALRQRRDHRHEARPERRGDRRGAAAAGTGCRRRQLRDEALDGQVTEATAGIGIARGRLYGRGGAECQTGACAAQRRRGPCRVGAGAVPARPPRSPTRFGGLGGRRDGRSRSSRRCASAGAPPGALARRTPAAGRDPAFDVAASGGVNASSSAGDRPAARTVLEGQRQAGRAASRPRRGSADR